MGGKSNALCLLKGKATSRRKAREPGNEGRSDDIVHWKEGTMRLLVREGAMGRRGLPGGPGKQKDRKKVATRPCHQAMGGRGWLRDMEGWYGMRESILRV